MKNKKITRTAWITKIEHVSFLDHCPKTEEGKTGISFFSKVDPMGKLCFVMTDTGTHTLYKRNVKKIRKIELSRYVTGYLTAAQETSMIIQAAQEYIKEL